MRPVNPNTASHEEKDLQAVGSRRASRPFSSWEGFAQVPGFDLGTSDEVLLGAGGMDRF